MSRRFAVWTVAVAVVGVSITAMAAPAAAEESPPEGGRPGRDRISQDDRKGPRPGAKQHRARRALRHSVKGEVTAVSADGFTLKTRRGAIQVQTSEQTKFHGGTEGDLSVGDKVAVVPACKPRPDTAQAERDRPSKKQPGDAPRACITGDEGSRTLKARAVLFLPGGSLRKDAVPSGKSRFSA